jgi:hypothetical protein
MAVYVIDQIATKYTNNYVQFQDLTRFTKIGIILFENTPSGNPWPPVLKVNPRRQSYEKKWRR